MGWLREWTRFLPFFLIDRWTNECSYDNAYLCWKKYFPTDKDSTEPVIISEVYDGVWIVRSQSRILRIKKQKLEGELARIEEELNVIPKLTSDPYDD